MKFKKEMKKHSVGIVIYATIGFFVGIWATYIVSWSNINPYWLIGPAFIILSVSIFVMRNWVRISIITLSIICILLHVFTIVQNHSSPDPFAYVLLSLLSPVLFFCMYSLVYLTRSKVKEQFKR
jgi:Mn2+/Fe2+ NRAMP family transporter